MFTAAGTFITTLVASAVTSLALPIVAIGLVVAGAIWAAGNHQRGKEAATAALIGGAVMLLAQTLSTGLGAIPHG